MSTFIKSLSGISLDTAIKDKSTKTMFKYHLTVAQKDRMSTHEKVKASLKKKKIKFTETMIKSESTTQPCIEFLHEEKKYRVVVKPKSGGSGAGARVTAVGESAQCYFLSAAIDGAKLFTKEELDKSTGACQTNLGYETVMKELTDDWLISAKLGAAKLKQWLPKAGKNYTFHRGSAWVKKMETAFKVCNDKDPAFSDVNKWTPADIWIVDKSMLNHDLKKYDDWKKLNRFIEEQYLERKIIGVSLKKASGTSAKISEKNLTGAKKPEYLYEGFSIGSTFFASKDSYLYFGNDQKMQFRTFSSAFIPSAWQGEIKGANANQGKMGGGGVQTAVSRKVSYKLTPPNTVKMNKKFIDKFYKYYKHLTNETLSYDEFAREVSSKGDVWFLSKYLSAEIIYAIDTSKKPADAVSALISYASSTSELSCVYAKVE